MSRERSLARRGFLKVSAAAGGGLLVGLYLQACGSSPTDQPSPTVRIPDVPDPTATPDPDALFEPSLFLKIDGKSLVRITVPRPDVGQGARTAVAMILADELGASWESVHVDQAPADRSYGNQLTGGSLGISETYTLLRRTGALARTLLITAAAKAWGVPVESCAAENSAVVHRATGERLTFGDLVESAASLPVPRLSEVKAKDPQEFNIIGTRMKRIDGPQMVDGSAIYGVDVTVPDMRYAVLARCPVAKGRLESFDASAATSVEGVQGVLPISNGVAVVAESTWAAIKGREALDISWDLGPNAELSTDSMREAMLARVVPEGWTGESTEPDKLAAVYEVPHLAHAPQEPLSCVADVKEDRCEVWAPTQNPADAKSRIGSITRLPEDAITVHIPLIGGGFGRRLQVDYVQEAVEVSSAVGHPVKLLWTREDDIQHDHYHPFSVHFVTGDLRNPKLPTVKSQTDGRIPNGPWRSVTNFPEAFVRECFVDEMASALGRDPLEFRLALEPRTLHPVLEKAAAEADWGSSLPDGWGRGIACHSTWNVTPVALVAEVSVSVDAKVRVHRVVCAVDCGLVINPNMVEEQMEGGIVFGLSAALKGSISFEKGRPQQSNFHDFPILTQSEMPQVEVHILASDSPPSGVGEMSIPAIAPAVYNAVFAATGKRIRRMPIQAQDLRAS